MSCPVDVGDFIEAAVAKNKGRSGSPVRVPPPERPSPELLIARARVHLAIVWAIGIFLGFVGLGLFALMAVPLAHAIAGKHTDFVASFSFSLNAALGVTTALVGGGLIIQTRRVSRYKSRTRKLEQRLEIRGTSVSGNEGTTSEQSSAKGQQRGEDGQ